MAEALRFIGKGRDDAQAWLAITSVMCFNRDDKLVNIKTEQGTFALQQENQIYNDVIIRIPVQPERQWHYSDTMKYIFIYFNITMSTKYIFVSVQHLWGPTESPSPFPIDETKLLFYEQFFEFFFNPEK